MIGRGQSMNAERHQRSVQHIWVSVLQRFAVQAKYAPTSALWIRSGLLPCPIRMRFHARINIGSPLGQPAKLERTAGLHQLRWPMLLNPYNFVLVHVAFVGDHSANTSDKLGADANSLRCLQVPFSPRAMCTSG